MRFNRRLLLLSAVAAAIPIAVPVTPPRAVRDMWKIRMEGIPMDIFFDKYWHKITDANRDGKTFTYERVLVEGAFVINAEMTTDKTTDLDGVIGGVLYSVTRVS